MTTATAYVDNLMGKNWAGGQVCRWRTKAPPWWATGRGRDPAEQEAW